MKSAAALLATLIAPAATAQTLTIDLIADNTETLTDDIVQFDVIVSLSGVADANFGAFADLAFDVVSTNTGGGLAPGYTYISHGWNNLNVINGFGDAFNAAGTATDGAGITGAVGQNSPPPGNFTGGPNTSLSILAYSFQIQFFSTDVDMWDFDVALSGQTTTAFGNPPFPGIVDWTTQGTVVTNGVTIEHNVPAPGPAAGLVIAGLAAARRRR